MKKENIPQYIKWKFKSLNNASQTLESLFFITHDQQDRIFCEYNDNFIIKNFTYSDFSIYAKKFAQYLFNSNIRDYVNPIQRELAEEYEFELLDLREEFEAEDNFESRFLRPNDGVHFTKEAAQFVAQRVWNIAKDLKF